MSIAVTTAVVASSSSAADSARRDARCREWMPGFEHDGASVADQQVYASCVDRLHPAFTAGDVVLIKVIVGVILLGALIGAVRARRGGHDTEDLVMGGIGGAGLAAMLCLVLAGVGFVFGG